LAPRVPIAIRLNGPRNKVAGMSNASAGRRTRIVVFTDVAGVPRVVKLLEHSRTKPFERDPAYRA